MGKKTWAKCHGALLYRPPKMTMAKALAFFSHHRVWDEERAVNPRGTTAEMGSVTQPLSYKRGRNGTELRDSFVTGYFD